MENEYSYADPKEIDNVKVSDKSLEYTNETLQEMRRNNNFDSKEMNKFGVASDSINSVYKQNASGFLKFDIKIIMEI